MAQEIPSLSPIESYSSSLILERTPRELHLSAFLLLFPGRPMCPGRALLFFGSPTYTPLTSDESSSVLWEAEIPPTEYSPSLVPLSVNSDEVEAVLFLKGQVNLQSRTGQVQGWDFCASVDDPSTHLHLLGLGGVRGRCETLPLSLPAEGWSRLWPHHLGRGRGRVGLEPASAPTSSDSLFLLLDHVG